MKIAVYGTLKSGFGNNVLMKGSTLLTEGKISGHRLFQAGIPYVVKDDTSDYDITVEVYEVPESKVPNIDSLEGHPDWYRREVTEVRTMNGDVIHAWVYKTPAAPMGTTENTTGVY